jgi:hypothetical protein
MIKKTCATRASKNAAATKTAPDLTHADLAIAQQVETKAYDFRGTVMLMDQASQHTFNKIVSIAKLARASILTIDGQFGPVGPDDIQNALTTIINLASEAKNDINVLAEDVDCSYSDERLTASA